jgi:hypothetical protein
MHAHAWPSVVSLARALLTLARTNATGVLHVGADRCACQLALVQGVVRAATPLPGRDRVLGDALAGDAALDADAHAGALQHGAPAGPIGEYLVATGLTTRPALELALRRQLRDRVIALFEQPVLEYRFEAGDPQIGLPFIDEPMRSADLVLAALRVPLRGWSHAQLCAALPEGELRLNALGHALTRDAALWPEEAATVALLRSGATLARVLKVTGGSLLALCMLALLASISGLGSATGVQQRYALLVRKRAQIARAEDPRALLDLPPDAATDDARRALRRMASSLHPDALGPDASDALRRASSEVMSALIDAERTLRPRPFS